MRKLLIYPLVIASLLLAGCSGNIPGVYKLDVQQGNVLTQESVAKLRPGMTKRQVNFLLGTPLIVDVFHNDRWDYLFSFQPGGGDRVQRRVSLHFKDDRLVKLEGDIMMAEDGVHLQDEKNLPAVFVEQEQQGFWDYMKETLGVGKKEDE